VDRRTFLKWLGIGAVTVALKPQSLLELEKPKRGTPGNMLVTAKEHGSQYRVYCDNQDITYDCYQADSGEGWADIYLRNRKGNLYVSGSNAASKRICGKIDLVDVRNLI